MLFWCRNIEFDVFELLYDLYYIEKYSFYIRFEEVKNLNADFVKHFLHLLEWSYDFYLSHCINVVCLNVNIVYMNLSLHLRLIHLLHSV